MVTLRQDGNGRYAARKRLPDDVREDYKHLYGAAFEAKFSAPGSVGKHVALAQFHQWSADVEQLIDAIRKIQRSEGYRP
jgi:hypothetical protein